MVRKIMVEQKEFYHEAHEGSRRSKERYRKTLISSRSSRRWPDLRVTVGFGQW